MDNLYFVILSNVILISLVNIFFNRMIYRGQAYYSVQFMFLCFIIMHSIYICLIRSFFLEADFINIGAPFGLFYAPFFFVGISVLINHSSTALENIWKHFIIGALFILFFLLILFFFRDNVLLKKIYLLTMYGLTCIQMILYCVFVFIKFNSDVKDKKSIAIMSQAIILMLSTALIFLAFVFSDVEGESNLFNSLVVYGLMLGAVIILFRYNLLTLVRKFKYYKKSYTGRLFFDYTKDNEELDDNPKAPLLVLGIRDGEEETVKYQKSRISEAEIKTYTEKLKKVMAAKIYLNSDLTLDVLARKVRIPKYHLTQVFNLGLRTNFNKFINAHRVQHAVSLLDDPNNQDSIEDIMMKSGFNSRSSFYRAFHLYYDISPVDYRKRKFHSN